MNRVSDSTTEKRLAQDLEGFLQKMLETSTALEEMDKQNKASSGRKKVLPSLVLWCGVVIGVLRGFKSQSQIWRLVSWEGFWNYDAVKVSDQAVYNRLADSENHTLQWLFVRVRDGLKERLKQYEQTGIASFATGVFAIDGSTLDKMARMLPHMREIKNGDSQLLGGKMVGLFNIRLQQWHEMVHMPNSNQNDKAVAQQLVSPLPKGSLILGDMGFFSFEWFDKLTDWKMWWISRIRNRTTYEVIHTYYTDDDKLFDGIVWLGRYRSDRAKHAVRLVTFTLNGHHYRYLTNVLDPKMLSLHEIATLYARRWDIELAFKMLKRHLNLHIIWSAKQAVVLQQLWAALIIAQLLHAVQLEIAGLAQVDPFDVSLDLVTQYVPRLIQEGKDPIKMIVEDGRRVGIIRPSRRIRPKTPPIEHLSYMQLPENSVLQRKPRYSQRRCKQYSLKEVGGVKASGYFPLLH